MFKIDDKRNTGRVHASKINLVYSLIFQMLILVMSFVVRSFFIKSLGSSYLVAGESSITASFIGIKE